MANFEKYLNEQGKNKSMEEIVKLAYEDGFDEGFELAMHYSDDPGDLGGRVTDRAYAKHMEKRYKEFLRNNKIEIGRFEQEKTNLVEKLKDLISAAKPIQSPDNITQRTLDLAIEEAEDALLRSK